MSKRIPPNLIIACREMLRPYLPPYVDEIALLRHLSALKPATSPVSTPVPATVPPGEALTVMQAAARLNVGRNKIFSMLNAGRLPRIKLGSRTLRIPSAAVEKLVNGEESEQ